MSNPAVIKLQSTKIGNRKVWLDDNFGESIHVHIDDIRIDLTVREFEQMYEDLCATLNRMVEVENFDAKRMDPAFISAMLWKRLPDLVGASIDNVRLGQMYGPAGSKVYRLPDSVGVQALKGLSDKNLKISRLTYHIGQTDDERLQELLESIKRNGYPYNDNYIVMYGEDNVIRDGQHRASCLYYLYGDIEVPVLRLYFKNYKPQKIDKFYNNPLRALIRSRRRIVKALLKRIKNFLKLVKRLLSGKKRPAIIDPAVLTMFHSK